MSDSMLAIPYDILDVPAREPVPKTDQRMGGLLTGELWDERELRHWIALHMRRDQVIVVSDRQPLSHERVDGGLTIHQPASGLVTAIEPVLRACGGTWIAHGSGNGDRDVVDSADRWQSADDKGAYQLRRVWITPDEQRGYRDGFSNSGMWPLCHLVHVRPVFTETDWRHYETVNRRFADAVVSEADRPDPIVFIQDYHLALVPTMLRERLPDATIILFWHIPWTPSEQMGICPWLTPLVDGMLGSDIIGFQTDQHRRNFVATAESCERHVELSDRRYVRGRSGRRTFVRDYPISVAWPAARATHPSSSAARARATPDPLAAFPPGAKLIVGIDRFDYTKGLVERLHAIEHLLQTHPSWQGRLRFLQVASPSRAGLAEYVSFRARVLAEVDRINARFSACGPVPITLLDVHHDHDAVNALYRAADVCLVTTLHDGMNLVSKEFVAARDDEQGVLVLSEFAGAARELGAALIVNPYHIAQVAEAVHRGLTMPASEQQSRMRALRSTVQARSVFRWAASVLHDAVRLRQPRSMRLPYAPSPP